MDKEEALTEFLKGLRISLNNASVYFKEHPFYIKSVREFKQKIDLLFTFLNPIKINVAAGSLFIEGKFYDKTPLYTELASMFHIRKIKSIEIQEGITLEELLIFLSALALSQRDILKRGGVKNILSKEGASHCIVEDLDYSQLLHGSGEETKDIWTYLFSSAAKEKNEGAIKQCVDNFESVVGNFKASDLIDDEELRTSICNFLSCLKEEEKDKFNKCSKEMFRAIMKYKGIIEPEQIEKIKAFFKGVNEEQFADLLLDGLTKDDNFDALSLQLFSKLTGEERQKDISQNVLNKINGKDLFKGNPNAAKKVKNLLAVDDNQVISEGYRNIIGSLLKDTTFEKTTAFDRSGVDINYRYILLNLLKEERDAEKLGLIISKLLEEWPGITKGLDTKYLRLLCDIEKEIKQSNPSLISIFEGLDKRFSEFLEQLLWEERDLSDLPYLIQSLGKSSSDADSYLKKIFDEGHLSPDILRLFFNSFPEQKEAFLNQLKQKHADIDFLVRLIKSIETVGSSLALDVLTFIYSFSNEIVRLEILEEMQGLPEINAEFIKSVLRKENARLKKEALNILSRDPQLRKEASDILLSVPSFLGMHNVLLLENMDLIGSCGFREALDNMYFLKNKRFFWNRLVRKKATEILEKLNARKD